ncbi:MAG: hypothetical protein P4L80_17630 [Xanthobacteraceae bacterium]|nr:hypothetical protein [Xanthobacteraceae bacterium]
MTSSPSNIEYLDLPNGWFALDVCRESARKWDWVALMIDVDPDDLKTCTCDFPALFYVHPNEYRPGDRTARQYWFRLPGKHRNRDAAWDTLQDLMATQRCGTVSLAHVVPTTTVDENGEQATLN